MICNHCIHTSTFPRGMNTWAFQGCPFYTLSWYYHLWLMNLSTCGLFQTGVFGSLHNFPFVAPAPTCLKHVADNVGWKNSGNNILDFYLKHKIIRLVYCVLSNTVSMLFLEEVWLCRHYSGACVERGEGKNWLKWFSILIDISVVPSMLKCQLRWQTLHLLNIGVLARSLWACC